MTDVRINEAMKPLVQDQKAPKDETPSAISDARKALERVFYWLAMGDEGPEADLPLPDELWASQGIADLLEQVRVAARGLGGLREADEQEALPAITHNEPVT